MKKLEKLTGVCSLLLNLMPFFCIFLLLKNSLISLLVPYLSPFFMLFGIRFYCFVVI